MKTKIIHLASLFLLLLFTANTFGQDNRTFKTKIADIQAQFPAQNAEHTNRLMEEIIELGNPAIAAFSDLIVPLGTGNDTQARYALESLARYAGNPENKKSKDLVEKALLAAIDKASDSEVKTFFIRRLIYCGTNQSVKPLSKYLLDKQLYKTVIAGLTTIGNEEAANELFMALQKTNGSEQIEYIKALGQLRYKNAEKYLIELYPNVSEEVQKQCLFSLANIAGKASEKTIVSATKAANFQKEPTESVIAYIRYIDQLSADNEKEISTRLSYLLLKECKQTSQLHFRSAALKTLRSNLGAKSISVLTKEIKNEDKAYRNAVLNIAAGELTNNELEQWIKTSNKVTPEVQSEIIGFLAKNKNQLVFDKSLQPALANSHELVRIAAIKAVAINNSEEALPLLIEHLKSISGSKNEYEAVKEALLIVTSKEKCGFLADQLNSLNENGKIVITQVIAARKANQFFNLVLNLCDSENKEISQTAYAALPSLASSSSIPSLLDLMNRSEENLKVANIQQALIAALENATKADSDKILSQLSKSNKKEKLIPVMPFLQDSHALTELRSLLAKGSETEKAAAFNALTNWTDAKALPILFDVYSDKKQSNFRDEALNAYLKQIQRTDIPNDQKLLWIKKIMKECTTDTEQNKVIRTASSVKTFLSLVFVSNYLDQDKLSGNAAEAAMRIALPSAGEKNGLTGELVRHILEKAKATMTGSESQYSKIDIREYLEKMPQETGYVPIFNGKDLSGWQGLVKNPIERSKMSAKQLAKEQEIANVKMLENWTVKDGAIVFNGSGDNLCTQKNYSDFDMLVDWRISKDGDSGIYLRGSPQVQIWDTARVEVGAQVGSGGLYNNKTNPSIPLVLADNAIGDWNTLRIRMVDQRVTVYLNGQLVVDNVIMENYWDRSIPIFREGPIELQAHGTDLAFRNIYVREISPDNSGLTHQEKTEGFTSLFNGKDLDNWIGNKVDYIPKDGIINVVPREGNHGNLYSSKEYENFIFRFDFQLTPGANNGLGIHAPLEGDAAYVGKELQILDNTAAIYANLEPYQYHGSVYGIIAAKKGFLKPVGEWNSEEVTVQGDHIKIILNGEVILDGDMKEASKKGTADHQSHPGLDRHKGHIAFLGHGSELKFRNIRIKELHK